MKNLLNKLLIPFAIIHIRIIQYRYKKLTTSNYYRRSNVVTFSLILLQMKEYYYKTQFSAWGKFHPSFGFSNKQMVRHYKYMNWLFPEKDFEEFDTVIYHKPEAVTFYHNQIYTLSKGKPPMYAVEIPKQIKKWKKEAEKDYK